MFLNKVPKIQQTFFRFFAYIFMKKMPVVELIDNFKFSDEKKRLVNSKTKPSLIAHYLISSNLFE